MISLRKERTEGDTGAVTGEKSEDGNLNFRIGDAFWVKERNKISKENNKFKQK